jgi:hypothetical protein
MRAKSSNGKGGEDLGKDAFRALGRGFKNLNYEEYFLVKGCQKIQSLSDYKKEISIRTSSL